MSTRDIMGNIQSFHDQRQGDTILDEVENCLIHDIDDVEQGIITQEEYDGQEECPDDVYHVQCYHCANMIDPNEDPVYCWSLGHQGQIFVCGGCDAEHRTKYISLQEEQNG